MAKGYKFSYKRNSAWGWGVFLILVAALILANQFGGFLELGFWSLAVAAIAAASIVHCIITLSFGSLPIPIAALYYIFQAPLELPFVPLWPTLILVTLLATIGLHVLLPQKRFSKFIHDKNINGNRVHETYSDGRSDIEFSYSKDDPETGYTQNGKTKVEEGGTDNNPRISLQFGGLSRYLHADALESAELDCSFGGLEVYFDNVTLSPNGADVYVSCKFGAIEMHVPKEWRIINRVSSTIGGMDISGRSNEPDEGAPVLRVTGNVSFGGIDIKRV